MSTSRSARSTGIGRNITALITEKIALLAPMPSAMVATAANANPGLASSRRTV
jgi:hypothetical protein